MVYLVACHCPANALLLNSDMIQVKLESSGKPQHVEMKQEFIMTKIRSFMSIWWYIQILGFVKLTLSLPVSTRSSTRFKTNLQTNL